MTALPLDLARHLSAALAAGPADVIELTVDLLRVIPGVTAVTILATASDRSVIRRVGTSHAASFPIGGWDPVDEGAWCRRIFGEKRPIVANSPAEMAVFIPETGDLVALGIGATMCVPIVIGGQLAGTVNVLGAAGILTPPLIEAVEAILPLAALIFTFPGVSETITGTTNDNLNQGDHHATV
jgi:GAF domain-containing protein